MEALRSFEALVLTKITVRNIPEDDFLQLVVNSINNWNNPQERYRYNAIIIIFSLLKSLVTQNFITIKTSWNAND
jgi:hypothetical protein